MTSWVMVNVNVVSPSFPSAISTSSMVSSGTTAWTSGTMATMSLSPLVSAVSVPLVASVVHTAQSPLEAMTGWREASLAGVTPPATVDRSVTSVPSKAQMCCSGAMAGLTRSVASEL